MTLQGPLWAFKGGLPYGHLARYASMPGIETARRPHDAVYWPIAGIDEHGESYVGDLVALKVRWEYRNEQLVGPTGNLIGIVAVVVVDRVVPPESKMWKGHIDDLPVNTGTGATELTGVMEVAYYNEIPDLKGRRMRRTVGLTRYMDQLPTEG